MLEVKSENEVLYVKLNRPELHNAFNPEMISELTKVFTKQAPQHRAVVLSGNGKSFCAGADLNWMQSMVKYTKAQNKADSLKLHAMFSAIQNCPVPVLTKIHGNVFAGGLGLVAASDIVIAESSTQFCFSEPKLGLVPAVISHFVSLKMNPAQMREVFLTAEVFGSTYAQHSGLVHFVGDTQACENYVKQKITHILKCGPKAVVETKKLLNALPNMNAAKRKNHTTQLIASVRVSAEGQEGLKSFLEKRKPKWFK